MPSTTEVSPTRMRSEQEDQRAVRLREAAQCLALLAAKPLASSQEIADGMAITDEQLVSLTDRMVDLGLIASQEEAWSLTPLGELVLGALRDP